MVSATGGLGGILVARGSGGGVGARGRSSSLDNVVGGGASSFMAASSGNKSVLDGERVCLGRRAGDWEPPDSDLVDVGEAGDHPSEGVAGTHMNSKGWFGSALGS